ncbi:MAG: pectate lyase, partial [Planctomycetota bacterium]|nr:pectate lyase [Planctomycetota bacterium]
FKEAVLRGLDYLLKAQYENGGWPQFYPNASGYHTHITFNDDAMIGVMRFLRDLAKKDGPCAFVDADRRAKAEKAVAKGIECILRCQVVVDGKRTVWCAQHDEATLKPAPARAYEKISLSGAESVGIVRFLMGVEKPGPEVIEAVQSAVAWFDAARITGIRQAAKPDPSLPGGQDKVIEKDPSAPPLWARFYEIGTNRPIFCGRDGVIKYSLAEIEHERRTGYAWYGGTPADLLAKDYPAWQAKWDPARNVLRKAAAGPAADAPPAVPALLQPLKSPCPAFVFAAESGGGWILRFARDGSIQWAYPAPMSRDVWLLSNGNVLFPYNEQYNSARHDNPSGVMEVTPDKKVVFQFKTTGQVWSCQRLPDGNTLVGAASQGKVLVVGPQGQTVREFKVKNAPGHSCMRHVRGLPDGGVLVAEESASAVRQYDAQGRLVHDWPLPFTPFSMVRLAGGRTLVCGRTRMAELDADGKAAWSLDAKDYPDLGIRWFAGLQVLSDGRIFVCNAGGKVGFVEFARDGKVVWKSNEEPIGLPMGHGVCVQE